MPDKTPSTTNSNNNNNNNNKKIIEPLPKKEATVPVKPNYFYEQNTDKCVCHKGMWCEECLGEYDDLLD